MANVTISLDDALLTRVRAEAAKEQRSVSRWIARELDRAVAVADQRARASAGIEELHRLIDAEPAPDVPPWKFDRDEIYEERFRRFDHAPLQPGPERAQEARDLSGVAEDAAGDEPSRP